MYKQTHTQRLKQRRPGYQHITADENKQKEKGTKQWTNMELVGVSHPSSCCENGESSDKHL